MVIRYPNGKLYQSAPKLESTQDPAEHSTVAKDAKKGPFPTVTVEKA